MPREPITLIEIDMGYCGRTWGTAPCTAALSASTPRKCFNTFATCVVQTAFLPAALTLRFCEPRANLPRGMPLFPVVKSVSMFSATVNIAGSDGDLSALGRRATVKIELADFAYHDRLVDKYQAERVSGAAQTDEAGYDPATRGTFLAKLRARWPYYGGRALRVVQGYLDGGVLTVATSRHFVITTMAGPDDGGRVTIEAQDVLALADNDRAVCPAPSGGTLSADLTISGATLTLTPAGSGADYPTAGKAVIGSEMVTYTRTADAITLTARGVGGTASASHSAGDVFQVVKSFEGVRIDTAVYDLLVNYAKVPTAYIPAATWAAEVDRWLPELRLVTDLCAPTGVAKLVGELAVLGVSIWWDDAAQVVGLKVNRPPDLDPVFDLTDRDNIKAMDPVDRNEDRLTEVYFFSVQIDPTKSATSSENFRRCMAIYDPVAKDARAHGDTRIRPIFCRWLNQGADSDVRVLGTRLLQRFTDAPVHARVLLDAKDAGIGLTDVIRLSNASFADTTGKPLATLMQVIQRSEPVAGHEIELVMQAYQFAGRYGWITENTCPDYDAATAEEQAEGFFIAADTDPAFPDGSGAYEVI